MTRTKYSFYGMNLEYDECGQPYTTRIIFFEELSVDSAANVQSRARYCNTKHCCSLTGRGRPLCFFLLVTPTASFS
jgi:hypothetical protein